MTVTAATPACVAPGASCCGHPISCNKNADLSASASASASAASTLPACVDASWNYTTPTEKKYPATMSNEEILVSASPCLHADIDDAVKACVAAQKTFARLPVKDRKRIIDSIRSTAIAFAEDFALAAFSETGRGRYEDKLSKQFLAARATPGVEDLAPKCFTGDDGLTTVDYAPFGVIGAVTPVTNPTATVINNAITILSGGNGVVFNPHPAAVLSTNRAIHVMNQAVRLAGGPCCLIASVQNPTIPSGKRLLTHELTACNLITGGPAVVKVALASGKRSFCAGPGNPPVVVDESADLAVAAQGIYYGASFDNNMICSDEKEVFVCESVADKLLEELAKCGSYLASPEETEKLTPIVIPVSCSKRTHGEVDRFLVGQNASVLLAKIGVTLPAGADPRLIVCETDADHPLIWTEQLMPVIPVIRVKNFEEGLALAKQAEYGYKHTSSIYSQNLSNITEMAREMNTSIFVVNGSHTAGLASGGEGYTSFSIAGTTGEGMTRPSTFVRERRLVVVNALRYV